MFRLNEIRPKPETRAFIEDLKACLRKHNVVMVHGQSHILFSRPDAKEFAQCFIVNGGSTIGK